MQGDRDVARDTPWALAWSMIISPRTRIFSKLGLLLASKSPRASELTRMAHDPCSSIAFSVHALRRTSRAEIGVDDEGGTIDVDSSKGTISLNWV